MKTIVLSDHVGERLRDAAEGRAAQYRRALASWQAEMAARERACRAPLDACVQAWRERRWWRLLLACVRLLTAKPPSLAPVAPPQPPVPEPHEYVWAGGREGEQRVAAWLGTRLSDEWVLICGYHNARGEIDQLLVGPTGVIAIEVKFLNGVVHCDGDRWWRDRYDRWGNCVETELPISDARGRSPSRQLNEAANLLQHYLARRIRAVQIARAVILAHDASCLGTAQNLAVDLLACLYDLSAPTLTGLGKDALDAAARGRLVEAIRRDHAFHERAKRPACRVA